ncbi:MAG: BMP family ABC transporter substrate-binding protein [Vallitaleaceae bacterium]|jgi:basic membrane protein A|nr:BMP family ABC transporter substrate-binding protein [Vallitaleaceae bacterium]
MCKRRLGLYGRRSHRLISALAIIMASVLLLTSCSLFVRESSEEEAEKLVKDGKFDEAVEMYEELIDEDEENHDLWVGLVEVHMEEEEWEAAADVMKDWADIIEEIYEDDPEEVEDAIKDYQDLKEEIEDEDEDVSVYVLEIGDMSNEVEAVEEPVEEPVEEAVEEAVEEPVEEAVEEEMVELIKVGMVTDSGTIDDKSFNQGTWEGILAYAELGTIEPKYLQPEGESETDYINAITNLVDAGYEIIVTPGFKFESAIYAVQYMFPDIKFILIDGMPHSADYSLYETAANVASIFFYEHEAGFLAGVVAALESNTGKLGFIGGMEIPPVQKFGWGFVAGVQYANDTFGTDAEVTNYLYQGSFSEVAAGQQIASGMYDEGIDIIFAAAGGVGVGVINEAKDRGSNGENVFVIGVDSDQYIDGIYEGDKSIILTSAIKKVDVAAYDYIDAAINGTFRGGTSTIMTLADNAVGLPAENPNLSMDTMNKVNQVKATVISGSVVVPSTVEEINNFLGYNFAE